jgi:hypothetical protein
MMNDGFDLATFDNVTYDFNTVAFGQRAGLLLQALIELLPVILQGPRKRRVAAVANAAYAGGSAITVIVLSSAPRLLASSMAERSARSASGVSL